MASGKIVRVTVLNDEATFSDIEGTQVVDIFIPQDYKGDETDFIEEALHEGTARYARNVDARWLCIVGNPFDGLTVMGPFSTPEEATEHGEGYKGMNWSIIQMTDPTA